MCQNRTDNKTTGPLPQLTSEDFALREWQLDVRGFGEAGQQRLKGPAFWSAEWVAWVQLWPMNSPQPELAG